MAAAERAWRDSLQGVTVADLAATVDKDSGRTALTALRGWLAEG